MFAMPDPAPNDADAAWPAAWREVYPELKKIARARLHAVGPQMGGGAGFNTTALVNESYLRLAQRVGQLEFASLGHFYAYAAHVMRSVIVDEVRERRAERRGGGALHVTLDTAVSDQLFSSPDEALAVDTALGALAQVEPLLAQVVEMRYFGGMTDAEIATALGLTDRTVRRDWDKARALLRTMV
jgi:RNA polymerase sigma factor (TIGR02999 family)